MAAQQFANNATTTLTAICNPGDSSISVTSASGFPSSAPYTLLIDTEYLLVTSGAGTTTWGVARAQEGSSAGTHSSGATVTQDFTVAGLNSLNQAYYPSWAVSGLTGAVQASRWVGATAGGPPASGTFSAGDFVTDLLGRFWLCTFAGSPGTWVNPAAPAAAAIPTSQSTTSATYTDLATVGPAVTIATGTSVLVRLSCLWSNSTNGVYMSVAVSGATTIAAADANAIQIVAGLSTANKTDSIEVLLNGLTPGINTLTAKYRSGTGGVTATFGNRVISGVPL